MTAERHGPWQYYRCSRQTYKKERCRARFTNATQAHADLRRICGQVQINRTTAEAIRQTAAQVIAQRAATYDTRSAALRDEHDRIVTQEMQLTEAFTVGDLTPEAYKTMSDGLRHRGAEIDQHIQRQPVSEEQLNARIKKTLEVATSLWDLYEPLDDARRAELLAVVFRTIVMGPDGIVGFLLKPPFDALQKRASASDQATVLVEVLERKMSTKPDQAHA